MSFKPSPFRIVLGWILTPIHSGIFLGLLILFHPLLLICQLLRSQKAFDAVMAFLARIVVLNIYTLASAVKVEKEEASLKGQFIIVSNHQSIYDIAIIMHYLKELHPRFIAKQELGYWIPTASFALRHQGHLLINRKAPEDALKKIDAFAKKLRKTGDSVVIFPEGTRAKDGELKKFKLSGFKVLAKNLTEAQILPVLIDGSWTLFAKKGLPLVPFCKIRVKIYSPEKLAAGKEEQLLLNLRERFLRQLTLWREQAEVAELVDASDSKSDSP